MKKMVFENWRKEKYQRDTVLLDYTKCPQIIEEIYEGKLFQLKCSRNYFRIHTWLGRQEHQGCIADHTIEMVT